MSERNGYLALLLLCVAGVAWNNATMWEWILDQVAWIAGAMVLMIPFFVLNRGTGGTPYSTVAERRRREREAAERGLNTSERQ